jgi:hypothetical protein
LGSDSTAGVGNDPIAPHTARIRGVNERRPREPLAHASERPGAHAANYSSCPRPRFKSPKHANHGRQATNPIGVLYSALSLLAQGEKGKGALRRRAAPGKEGAGSEELELRKTTAGVDIYTAGNAYIALNIFTTPPSTPSRPRLHRRPTVSTARPIYSLLPLGLFPVMDRRRRDASPVYMPGCWPSSRRTAVPRRRGLLSRSCSWAPPSPCEEGVWDRPSCRVFLCRE